MLRQAHVEWCPIEQRRKNGLICPIVICDEFQSPCKVIDRARKFEEEESKEREQKAEYSPHRPPEWNRILGFPRPDLYRLRVPTRHQGRMLEAHLNLGCNWDREYAEDGYRQVRGMPWVWRKKGAGGRCAWGKATNSPKYEQERKLVFVPQSNRR